MQKNEELSNALHYSQKRDEELTKALKVLGMVFTNIFLVHLEDQKVEWLKIQADKENVLKQCQNVYEIRKLIHDNYMLPECQNDYLEFTDLDTISERFEKHKILRYIYRNIDRQWIEVSALQKNEELSNALHYSQKRDEELTKALKVLGMVFTNIFLVHLEDQKVEWLKIQADKENVLKQCQNVYEIRKLIHDNYMLPECQNDYLEFTDLDTISERFEKHKILRYIYRNIDRQWIEVSAIVQNRDKDGRVTDILFLTHDVTDQRERELQQEDALRLALASAEHANKAKTAGSLY